MKPFLIIAFVTCSFLVLWTLYMFFMINRSFRRTPLPVLNKIKCFILLKYLNIVFLSTCFCQNYKKFKSYNSEHVSLLSCSVSPRFIPTSSPKVTAVYRLVHIPHNLIYTDMHTRACVHAIYITHTQD